MFSKVPSNPTLAVILSAVPGHVHQLSLLQHAWAWAGPAAGLSTALPKWAIWQPDSQQHSKFHCLLWQQV